MRIDLNEHPIRNKEATFLFRVKGDKLANFVAKKHPGSRGVFNYNDLTEAQQTKLLTQITVDEVWGVGRKLTKRLAEHNIHTVAELRAAHTPTLRAEFGVVMKKTQSELQGLACADLQEVVPNKQQIISSRSFGGNVQNVDALKDAMSTFVANACAKLRAQASQASVIQACKPTDSGKTCLSTCQVLLSLCKCPSTTVWQ